MYDVRQSLREDKGQASVKAATTYDDDAPVAVETTWNWRTALEVTPMDLDMMKVIFRDDGWYYIGNKLFEQQIVEPNVVTEWMNNDMYLAQEWYYYDDIDCSSLFFVRGGRMIDVTKSEWMY